MATHEMCLVRQRAAQQPHAAALVYAGGILDYAGLDEAIRIVADKLTRQAGRNTRLGLLARPGASTVIALHAAFRAGRTICPINPAFPPEYQEAVARRLSLQMLDTETLASPRPADSPLPVEASAEDHDNPATIVLSSGSTGVPKAVAHAYRNHVAAARAANANMPLAPGDRWLLSLPLYHVAGIAVLFRCALAGAAVALQPQGTSLPEAIRETGATHISLVATQLQRLLKEEAAVHALARLKGILLGGGPFPPTLIRHAHELGLPIHKSYGMTETCSQITATPPGASLRDLLTAGKPLAPDSVRISEDGEIFAGGEALFLGYLEEHGLRLPLGPEKDFATGDLGQWDPCGNLIVVGRKDNMFISGGENIHPEEVERALLNLPDIGQALVVPVEDAEFGARPAAFIATVAGGPFDAQSLEAALSKVLPRFKVPRCWLPWPAQLQQGLKPSRVEFRRIAAESIDRSPKEVNSGSTACASQEPRYV